MSNRLKHLKNKTFVTKKCFAKKPEFAFYEIVGIGRVNYKYCINYIYLFTYYLKRRNNNECIKTSSSRNVLRTSVKYTCSNNMHCKR